MRIIRPEQRVLTIGNPGLRIEGALASAAFQALLDRLAALGLSVSDAAALETWFEAARETTANDAFWILTNPATTDRIHLDLRSAMANQKVSAWWDDGTTNDYTLQTGSNTAVARTYAAAAARVVVIAGAGNVKELRSTYTDGRTVWGCQTTDLPAGLTYLFVHGSNTISGPTGDLPAGLTLLAVVGSNTISGATGDLPAGLTFLIVDGSNTISGPTGDLPAGLTYLYVDGSNTISGPTGDLPAGLTFLSVSGSNTIDWTSGIAHLTAIRACYVRRPGGVPTAEIDALINSIWTARNGFTSASNIRLEIQGYTGNTNGAPTGTVQNVCPPTTPGEKIYNLCYRQCGGDTHKKWSPIIYTGGQVT